MEKYFAGVAVTLMLTYFGVYSFNGGIESVANNCNKMNAFKVKEAVYECKLKGDK